MNRDETDSAEKNAYAQTGRKSRWRPLAQREPGLAAVVVAPECCDARPLGSDVLALESTPDEVKAGAAPWRYRCKEHPE